MDFRGFLQQLPTLYLDWDQPSLRPRSDRFQRLLNAVEGLTTANVLQLLNSAVSCLEEGEVYCEVGSYRGATLLGALLGHPGRLAYAADNFTQFDPQGQNQYVLHNNLVAFNMQDQVRFANQDFEDFLVGLQGAKVKVGVYLYDGAHDYRSQLLGLLLSVPLLADRALLVVDDSNWPAVRQATWDFLAIQPSAHLLLDLPTPGNGYPTFWNGLLVLGWEAGSHNGYDREMFRRARQPDLRESPHTLQQVETKAEGEPIRVVPVQ